MNRAQVKNLETIPQSVYPKCPPLSTRDWCTQRQHEYCNPEQLDYAVRKWVCSAGTHRYATANAAKSCEVKQKTN